MFAFKTYHLELLQPAHPKLLVVKVKPYMTLQTEVQICLNIPGPLSYLRPIRWWIACWIRVCCSAPSDAVTSCSYGSNQRSSPNGHSQPLLVQDFFDPPPLSTWSTVSEDRYIWMSAPCSMLVGQGWADTSRTPSQRFWDVISHSVMTSLQGTKLSFDESHRY